MRNSSTFISLVVLLAVGCNSTKTPSQSEPSSENERPNDEVAAEWDTPDELESDPGRVTLHRLNNRELELSVQSLVSTEVSFKSTLPKDPMTDGFDNNAKALTVGTLHVETIESAIDSWIDDGLRAPIFVETNRYEPENEEWSGGGGIVELGGWNSSIYGVSLYHGSAQSRYITVNHSGTYTVRVRACHELYGAGVGPTAPLEFRVDNQVVATFTVVADSSVNYGNHCKLDMQTYEESDVLLEAGETQITVNNVDYGQVGVDWVELEGPLEATGELPPGRAKIYVCDPVPESGDDLECAREIVHNFMDEAWRRPVSDAEVDSVMVTFDLAIQSGSDVHEALTYALKRSLMSPWFLFRTEIPSSPENATSQPLTAHELATRVSYFIWSRHPDAELRAAADDGSLLEDAVLEAQTRRLLADIKAEALVEGFGAHWLGLPDLSMATPDPELFPNFNDELRQAMDTELRDLIRRALQGELNMLELLTADTTWLEPILASHYGIEQNEGSYANVEGRNGGVFTTAAFLTFTSNSTRTSPVRRGHWVVNNIMCEKSPPPPDGVEQSFDESEDAATVPEQLAAHRANPACASCHDQLDPIGIALEGFDAVGVGRSAYADGNPIETSGDLPGVGNFNNVSELALALSLQERTHRCMIQKALTYALGRKAQANDLPFIAPIMTNFKDSGYYFEEMAVAIVQSELFRQHRGEE